MLRRVTDTVSTEDAVSLMDPIDANAPTEKLPALTEAVAGAVITELPCGGYKGAAKNAKGAVVTGYGRTEDACRGALAELLKIHT